MPTRSTRKCWLGHVDNICRLLYSPLRPLRQGGRVKRFVMRARLSKSATLLAKLTSQGIPATARVCTLTPGFANCCRRWASNKFGSGPETFLTYRGGSYADRSAARPNTVWSANLPYSVREGLSVTRPLPAIGAEP